MFESRVADRYRRGVNDRFFQGDILKDLRFIIGPPDKDLDKDNFYLPYAVILSQDCDLSLDYITKDNIETQDKQLLSLLVCPAFIKEEFAKGEHLGDLSMKVHNEREIEKICNNDMCKRYHYLHAHKEFSVPELIIDFKHFFSLPKDFLYNQKNDIYVASINEIFREELSQRFAYYLSRIGLPEIG